MQVTADIEQDLAPAQLRTGDQRVIAGVWNRSTDQRAGWLPGVMREGQPEGGGERRRSGMNRREGDRLVGEDRAQVLAGGDAVDHGAVLGDEGEGGKVELADEFGDDVPREIVQHALVEQPDQPVEEIFHSDGFWADFGVRIEDVFVGAQDIQRTGGDGGVAEAEEIFRIAEFAYGKDLQINTRDFALDIISGEGHENIQIGLILTPRAIGGKHHPLPDISLPEDTHDTLATMEDIAIGRNVFGAAKGKDLEFPKLYGCPLSIKTCVGKITPCGVIAKWVRGRNLGVGMGRRGEAGSEFRDAILFLQEGEHLVELFLDVGISFKRTQCFLTREVVVFIDRPPLKANSNQRIVFIFFRFESRHKPHNLERIIFKFMI